MYSELPRLLPADKPRFHKYNAVEDMRDRALALKVGTIQKGGFTVESLRRPRVAYYPKHRQQNPS